MLMPVNHLWPDAAWAAIQLGVDPGHRSSHWPSGAHEPASAPRSTRQASWRQPWCQRRCRMVLLQPSRYQLSGM